MFGTEKWSGPWTKSPKLMILLRNFHFEEQFVAPIIWIYNLTMSTMLRPSPLEISTDDMNASCSVFEDCG